MSHKDKSIFVCCCDRFETTNAQCICSSHFSWHQAEQLSVVSLTFSRGHTGGRPHTKVLFCTPSIFFLLPTPSLLRCLLLISDARVQQLLSSFILLRLDGVIRFLLTNKSRSTVMSQKNFPTENRTLPQIKRTGTVVQNAGYENLAAKKEKLHKNKSSFVFFCGRFGIRNAQYTGRSEQGQDKHRAQKYNPT